jgi:cytidylate kinase
MIHPTERPILILAGRLCAGKTTVARIMLERLPAQVLSARETLQVLGSAGNRDSMQVFGAELEERTGGTWLAEAALALPLKPDLIVVDSARTPEQAEALRALSTNSFLVCLCASDAERKRRFANRADRVDIGKSFEMVDLRDIAEVDEIQLHADLVIDTDAVEAEDVAETVLKRSPIDLA